MKSKNFKGQGSLEYLLLIGGGVLVTVVVIVLLVGLVQSSGLSLRGIWGTGLSTITGEEVTVTFPIGSIVIDAANPNPPINYSTPFGGAASSAVITFNPDGSWNLGTHCLFIDGTRISSDGAAPPSIGPIAAGLAGPGSHVLSARSGTNPNCDDGHADDFVIKNAEIHVTFTAP